MCAVRAVFAHFNSVLAVLGGAALAAIGAVLPGELLERAQAVPGARALLLAPCAGGPLLLALAHLGVAALHATPGTARVLLAVYAACGVLVALATGGVAGWAGCELAAWLRSEDGALQLHTDERLRAWLRPMLSLMPGDVQALLPEEGIRAEVVVVLVVCALAPLLLLVSAALAAAARPRRRRDDEHALRRCSSMLYEASAPPAYKTPLGDPSAWQ